MIVVFFLCLLGFFLGYWAGRLLKLDFPQCRLSPLNAGMRNTSGWGGAGRGLFPRRRAVSGWPFLRCLLQATTALIESTCGPPGPAGRIRRPTKRAWRRNRPGNGICSASHGGRPMSGRFSCGVGDASTDPPRLWDRTRKIKENETEVVPWDRPERKVPWLPAAGNPPQSHAAPGGTFEETGLRELAESIRRHGILQPLTARRTAAGWELAAGERRLAGSRAGAGLETVPCLEAEVDGGPPPCWPLWRICSARDLHYLEWRRRGHRRLSPPDGHDPGGAVAHQLSGMSPSALANKLRLPRLSPARRALLVEHGLTERHARCLLRLEDEGERLTALRQAAAKHWNVAQTEQYVERRLAALQTAPPAGRRTYIIKDVRLFLNSVDRGLRLILQDGSWCGRPDGAGGDRGSKIALTLRIPKQRRERGLETSDCYGDCNPMSRKTC
ncbi:MAG: ParB N-terminal domain-containing protein [Oscillibacter sp.]